MTKTIKAIKIDPVQRSIIEVRLPVEPGNAEEYYGEQVALDILQEIIRCETIQICQLDYGNIVVVDEEALVRDEKPSMFWQWRDDPRRFCGVCIIVGHIASKDEWCSTMVTVEECEQSIEWTRRKVRGHKVSNPEPGIMCIELVAPIIEEK